MSIALTTTPHMNTSLGYDEKNWMESRSSQRTISESTSIQRRIIRNTLNAYIAVAVFAGPTPTAFATTKTTVTHEGREKSHLASIETHQNRSLNKATESFSSLRQQVKNYQHFTKGWDGDEGRPASGVATSRALAFLDLLEGEAARPPIISLSGDGEINFFWKNEIGFVDLGFDEDGSGSLFAKEKTTGEEVLEDWEKVPESINSKIKQLITG